MRDDEVVNARIRKTDLGFHDGFGSIRNSWLHLEGDGWGQGFGGFALGGEYTDAWVYGILDALECESWEKLAGQLVRAQRVDGTLVAIGHPIKNSWFNPKAAFAKLGAE